LRMKKEICMLEFISKESRSNLGAFWKLAARSQVGFADHIA